MMIEPGFYNMDKEYAVYRHISPSGKSYEEVTAKLKSAGFAMETMISANQPRPRLKGDSHDNTQAET